MDLMLVKTLEGIEGSEILIQLACEIVTLRKGGFPVGLERSRLDSFHCWKFPESLTGVGHCGIARREHICWDS